MVKPFGGGPRGCGERGPYANSIVGRDGFELRRSCAAEHDPSHRGPRKWLQAIAQRSVRRARRWCVRRSNAACTAAVRGHPALLAERDFSCAGRSVRCHAAASVFAVDRCRKLCQRSPAPVSALAGRGGEAAYPDGRERRFREPDFRRGCETSSQRNTAAATIHFVSLPRLVFPTSMEHN